MLLSHLFIGFCQSEGLRLSVDLARILKFHEARPHWVNDCHLQFLILSSICFSSCKFLSNFSNQDTKETPIFSWEAIKLIVGLQLHFYDILSLTFGEHTHTHFLSSSLTHTNSHKHKRTHGVSLPRHMHTFTHTFSLSSTHFSDVSLALTHLWYFYFSLPIYLSRKHRKMMSLPHTRACTHPHAHTHARWQGYFCHCLRA